MNNRNLHSPTKLTEFARNFDTEPDTLLSKFVNKITYVYNSGYNSVNVIPTSSPVLNISNSTDVIGTSSQNSTPTHSSQLSLTSSPVQNSPSSSSKHQQPVYNADQTSPVEDNRLGDLNDQPRQIELPLVGGRINVRTPSNVLQRISNLMALRNNNNLTNYKNTELHQFWMPDSKSKECYECTQKFSTFRRKHHCRLCGQIFCSKCCNQAVPGKIINCSGDLKVCTYCLKIVLTYLKSSDINSDLKSDLQALQDDLSNKLSLQTDDANNHTHETASPQRKVSVGYQEERLITNPKYSLSNADRKNILQQSTSLKILYEDMTKALPAQNRGSDILTHLIAKNKSSNKAQAVAILNAMLEAGYIIEINGNTVAADAGEQSDTDALNEFNENGFYRLLRINEVMANSGSFELNLDVDNSSVFLSRSESNIGSNENIIRSHENKFTVTQLRDVEEENSLYSTTGSKGLQEAFCKHEELLVAQLLRSEHLDETWAKTLLPICARIVNTLPPEVIGNDLMDIRNYVNFKKVPDGSRKECCIIGGAVFTKNVVHKEMATTIENPRILLLQCPIVYQRVEGKFISIETLLLQEHEYLTNVIGRIRSLNPNVVLVHKNVSGIAKDMLRNCRITLVVDVKLSVLKRLSRCLQCDIVTSIDSNIGRPKLGTCDKFYIKNFTNSVGLTKTLIFMETSKVPRGCSVLLRGGNLNELVRVKKVASFLLFARYNWRLEISFLLDEFACPPSPKPSIFDTKDYSPCDVIGTAEKSVALGEALVDTDRELNGRSLDNRTKKLFERKSDDKLMAKENVQDFSDPLRATDLSPSTLNKENSVEFAVEMPYDNRFRMALNSTILSISPFLQLPLPFLETEIGRKCILRSRFPNELYFSGQWAGSVPKSVIGNAPVVKNKVVEMNPPHEFLTTKIVSSADSKEFQNLLAMFRASGGIFKKKAKMTKVNRHLEHQEMQVNNTIAIVKDALDISNHQRLPVLFCSYYHNPGAPSSFCAQPFLLNMSFYGENDIMLGQFLERYCFRSSYICSSCKLPMLDHVRRYVHCMGCIQVKLTEDLHACNLPQILMTSWCTKCQLMTPSVAMQKDTWCYSFGKYLEMRFYGHAYRRRQLDKGEAVDDNGTNENEGNNSFCTHSLHRDHVQYFSFNGIVATFTYSPIEVWEIYLPSLKILLKTCHQTDSSQFVDEVKGFAVRGYDIYAKIYDKVAQLSSDQEIPMLSSLKKSLNSDQLIFREKVNAVQALLAEKAQVNTHDVNDSVLIMKKTLAENIDLWAQRLNEAAAQSRAMYASAKQQSQASESTSSSSSQLGSVDAGTICTEDLNPESESPASDEFNRSDSVFTQETTSDIDINPVEREQRPTSSSSSDKKSVKTILRELLPSDKPNQTNLQSPFPVNEHHSLPTGQIPILVHDQDLSSVIAYSLMSTDYRKALKNLSYNDVHRKSYDSCAESDEKDSKDSEKEKEKEKKSKTNSHIDIYFQDLTTQFTCKVYFARDFDAMRNNFIDPDKNGDVGTKSANRKHTNSESEGQANKELDRKSSSNSLGGQSVLDSPKSDDNVGDVQQKRIENIRIAFARSLSRSIRWEARGGKSGSKFCKTLDDRFVLKEMSKQELTIFENFAPNYFVYINQCLQQNYPTLLAKIFGVFKVTIKKKDQLLEKSLLVMENLFYNCDISNKFDLKGSVRNRLVNPTNQNGEEIVLLDENLIQMSWSNPLYILTHSKMILREAINRDASFLEKNEVMDYSLLVGLNSSGRLLVLGIIDYIRTFTFDKRLESIVKQTPLLGRQGVLPTIISPKLYRQRFSEAMERYFLAVPDHWEGLEKNI